MPLRHCPRRSVLERRDTAFGSLQRSSTAQAGDMDGDVDIVVNQFEAHHLLRNDGGGAFLDETIDESATLGTTSSGALPGDIDGDGDLDLALSNRPRPTLWNLDRHLSVLHLLRLGRAATIRIEAQAGRLPAPGFAVLAFGPGAAVPISVPGIGRTPSASAERCRRRRAGRANDASRVGAQLWLQAALLDASGIRPINAVRETNAP